MTGGRTRARYQLAIEALVSTTPRGRTGGFGLMPEHQRICDLCVEVKSLAEIAALMRMPLGVARVTVGGIAEAGRTAVHQCSTTAGRSDVAHLGGVPTARRDQ